MFRQLLIGFVGLALVANVFTGCSDEYTDMTTSFQTDLCVVHRPLPQHPLILSADLGGVLLPAAGLDTNLYKPGERYLVTFIPMDSTSYTGKSMTVNASGRLVRVLDMQPVLVKSIQDATEPVPSGNDPVKLTTPPWLGGGFLNVEFKLRFRNGSIKHTVSMEADSFVTKQDAGILYLTFRHDANGDGDTQQAISLVSFTLTSRPEWGKVDSLVVRVLEWGGSGNEWRQYALAAKPQK